MLEILLFIAISIIGAQAIIIALLIKLVEKTREDKVKQGKELKGFIRALIKTASETQEELEDYKDAYNACHKEFSILFKENKILKDRLEYVENLHSHMVNNMHILLKEGRILKSRYSNRIIPYESFNKLTAEDRYELFGA
jgi:hypothetical protein